MPRCSVRLRGLLLCFTFGGGAVMGWFTILRLALAAWKLIDGWKTYTGAGLIAAASVGYYASCPRVVMADGETAWPSTELWVMLLGLGSSLAVAGLKHALEKLKSAVNAEVYQMIVDIVRQAFAEAVKPTPEPQSVFQYGGSATPVPVFHVPTHMDPPAGGVGRVDSLPGGMTAERTASGATTIGCLALILGLAASASAAPPKAFINGPSTGTPGELLTLDASQSEGDDLKFLWRVQPDVAGRKTFQPTCKEQSKIHICSMPGVWSYTLVVSNAEGADLLTWVVTIPGTPQPTPSPLPPTPPAPDPKPEPTPPVPPLPTPVPPGPGPAPTPTPVPPSRYGLDTLVTGWAAGIPEADRIAYAGVCESVAALIVATKENFIGDPNEVAKKVAAALTDAVKAARVTPSLKLAEVLGKLSLWIKTRSKEKGDLKTGEDFAVVLREVAAGLRGVK